MRLYIENNWPLGIAHIVEYVPFQFTLSDSAGGVNLTDFCVIFPDRSGFLHPPCSPHSKH